MRTKVAIWMLGIVAGVGSVAAEDIETINHQVYKNATVSRVEPDGIVIAISSGIVTIPFSELSQEYRSRFGYDEAKAKEFADVDAKRQRELYDQTQSEKAKQQKLLETVENTRAAEKELEAARHRNQALTDKAIAEHKVFTGMSQEQCVQSLGQPDKINTTITSGGSEEQWVYRLRRHYWLKTVTREGRTEGWVDLPAYYLYFENGILRTIQN
jgi:hypothetical protein